MEKSTGDYFKAAILRVLPEKPGVVVIHSSLPDLMPPLDFFPSSALYGLDALVQRGWTVALPAFTFSFCRSGIYSAKKSPSETGVLADALLRYCPEAARTPHPIYSFAAIGPRVAEIVACPSSTTFGDDSPFGLFERENATVVMMGCTWASNTQIHRYEELAAVPYRYPKVFSGAADYGAGPSPVQATMWVRDLAANPINDFSLAERNLRAAGLIVSAPLWRETIEAAAALDIARICRADLASNPYAYVSNAAAVLEVLAQQARATVKFRL
jgi:aminoglycoside N3'-acetyltransferase